MKISLNYEDRNFFHPSPSAKMMAIIPIILKKLNWQIEMPVEYLTREEAKQLIEKGIRTAKRKGIMLTYSEIDEANAELQIASELELEF